MTTSVTITGLERAPAVLLPYQQRWVADRTQVKVYEKSRRIGISWATACESALLSSTARDAGGMDCWYVGYNKDMALEFIRDVANWARHFDLAAGEMEEEVLVDEDKDILAFVIRFASGFRVTALSSRPSNLRGKQGYVILDEAAFHEQLDELLKAALALLMWGGRVAIVSTHDGVENAFNGLVLDVRAKKRPFAIHRTTLDDALEEGLYQRICLRLHIPWSAEGEAKWRQDLIEFYGDGADEELFCVPKNSGGAYLSRGLIEARMHEAPIVELELKDEFAHQDDASRERFVNAWLDENVRPLLEALPRNLCHALGMDFGRISDLSSIAPITIDQSLMRRVPFMLALRNVPYRQQEQILFYVLDRLPRFCGAKLDATGNGGALAEFAAQRYPGRVEQVKLSEPWYAEHLPKFKAGLEDGLLLVPRDANVLSDLRAFQVIGGVPKLPKAKTKGTDGKKRHGDSAIALVLGYAASSMEAEEFGYTPVSPRSVFENMKDRLVRVTAGFRGRKGVW